MSADTAVKEYPEINADMVDAGVSVCMAYDIENVAFLDRLVADIYRAMFLAGPNAPAVSEDIAS